jgi:hypothetical protein
VKNLPTRTDIISAALALEHKPFRKTGAQEFGMNCIGFFAVILRNVGGFPELLAKAEAGAKYPREKSLGHIRRMLNENLRPIQVRHAGPADVLLFRDQGREQHIGLITRPGYVIHASELAGCVIHHRLTPQPRAVAAYEIPGLT